MRTPIFLFRGAQTTLQPGDQMLLLKEGPFYFLQFKRGDSILLLQGGLEGKPQERLLYQSLQAYPIAAEIGELIAAACGLSVEINFSPTASPDKLGGPITASVYTFR